MANTVIAVNALYDYNKFAEAKSYAALTEAVDGTSLTAEITTAARDEKCLFLIQNAGATDATATVKAGNGIQGVNDISVSIPAGSYTIVSLDSGAFKYVTGENKGKILIAGSSADIKVAAFKLP